MSLDELCASRTKAKTKVTRAVTRLTDSIPLGLSPETIYKLYVNLEELFNSYMDVSDEYRELCQEQKAEEKYTTVNKMNLTEYDTAVRKKLLEGKSVYDIYVSSLQAAQTNVPPARPQIFSPSASQAPSVYLKKRDPPTFSGYHKDWPEFSSLWTKMMVPALLNKTALAHELKKSCSGGPAIREIENISAGVDDAYDLMWAALESHFGNVTLSVSAALAEIKHLFQASDEDYEGTVRLLRKIDGIYKQLEQLKQTNMVSAREVNEILFYLPAAIHREWAVKYQALDSPKQLHPFDDLNTFLQEKLKVAKLMAETKSTFSALRVQASATGTEHSGSYGAKNTGSQQDRYRSQMQRPTGQAQAQFSSGPRNPSRNQHTPTSQSDKSNSCLVHNSNNHRLLDCQLFKKMSASERRDLVVQAFPFRCKRCLEIKPKGGCKCPEQPACSKCGTSGFRSHNSLICHRTDYQPNRRADANMVAESQEHAASEAESPPVSEPVVVSASTSSIKCHSAAVKSAFYAIYSVPVSSSTAKATVFCDDGADSTFISEAAAKKLKATKIKDISLTMTTLHGTEDIKSSVYEVELITKAGRKVRIVAFSRPNLTNDVVNLNTSKVTSIFPDFDAQALQRPSGPVDILLGTDYFSLHPKQEISSASNLSIMEGALGVCLQGTHPALSEDPSFKKSLTSSYVTSSVDKFITGEQLGIEISPKCGACKCGKCPLPGHSYSFQEEQELNLIKSGLRYDSTQGVWYAKYPWTSNPRSLPDNYSAAKATLFSTEKKLGTDPAWAEKYAEQIKDHEDRGVARKLTSEELRNWTGAKFYLSHMALEQPKSLTTPVRLVFNSSQLYRGVSLNSFLAKGPDAYNNSLLGLLLVFKELPVALVGDIRKMYNSVHLEEQEIHTHRFLWRDMEDRQPDIWCITRVNLGDKPAGTIAIVARDMTAQKFGSFNPEASDMITYHTYTDDMINSVLDQDKALTLSADVDLILSKGGFHTKSWTFGGVGVTGASAETKEVLGVSWIPAEDVITFPSKINFSPKKRNVHSGEKLQLSQIPTHIPAVLTRRLVLQQVMGIFDPYGLLAPFLLKAKILLRETWILELGWDDALPQEMRARWVTFFKQVFDAEKLKFPRCLRPGNAVGDPSLVILSDGSEVAYGCAAYIIWSLADGSTWARLILAKCRIAPINRISIPQMELNGAVLSKRVRKIIETESRFNFETVLQLVDSETVLHQIHGISTRFKVYEGVRIGEIQAATGGDLSSWAWISGAENIADWTTRGKPPAELGPDTEWFSGPAFMRQPISSWSIKHTLGESEKPVPGEKVVKSAKKPENQKLQAHSSAAVVSSTAPLQNPSYSRCSRIQVTLGAYARVIAICRNRSFRAPDITPALLKEAELHLIKEAQDSWNPGEVKQQFRTIAPRMEEGLWIVGARIAHASPLTPENKPQTLIPPKNSITRRLMEAAHRDCCHGGRDATLARFRAKYWTSHAAKISQSVCSKCQMCRLVQASRLKQMMGNMPPARLIPGPPFNKVVLDLFGPFHVRGEVQKRTTGKAWGLLITDLCSRAVHIEVMYGYDVPAVMLALRRFAAVRGWPAVIFSDPGSQLKGASEELKRVWDGLDKDALNTLGVHKGLTWKFGPADSPWYQGAAEALIKGAKKAITLAIGHQRMSAVELLTVFSEAANLMNERPIGFLPSPDSHLNILTANSLLLGRSTAINPGGYEASSTLQSRVSLVQKVIDQFWLHWTQLYAPTLVQQSKWLTVERDLEVDDVVLVADSNPLKAQYSLARVYQTIPSADGKIRKVRIAYKNYKVGEALHEYGGAKDKIVERAVQSLSLLVPVDSV